MKSSAEREEMEVGQRSRGTEKHRHSARDSVENKLLDVMAN